MPGTLRIEPPKPEWLTLERACFGFEARVGERTFSFDKTLELLNLRAMHYSELANRYSLMPSAPHLRIVLYDREVKNVVHVRSIDEIPPMDELHGDKYNAVVNVLSGFNLPAEFARAFSLSRELLLMNLTRALDEEFARVFARVGSPLTSEFTEIPADVIRAFTIEQFRSGFATAVDGSRLFCIHVAPEGGIDNKRPSPSNLPPKQASLARYIMSEHGGKWPDSQWKSLLSAFEAWTDIQTGGRTTIGRSAAADLKHRFPHGFSIDVRPLDTFGR